MHRLVIGVFEVNVKSNVSFLTSCSVAPRRRAGPETALMNSGKCYISTVSFLTSCSVAPRQWAGPEKALMETIYPM